MKRSNLFMLGTITTAPDTPGTPESSFQNYHDTTPHVTSLICYLLYLTCLYHSANCQRFPPYSFQKWNAIFFCRGALLHISHLCAKFGFIKKTKKRRAAAVTPQKAEATLNKNILNKTKHPLKLHTSQSSIYKKY